MNATVLWVTRRLMLPDQGFESSLTNNWKNHLAHDAIGVADSSFSDAEQNAGLSAYLAVFLEELFNDPPFGPNRDAVRDLKQQLHKAVDDLGFAWNAVKHQKRQPDAFGMAA
jgi:hypothetical protein